MYNSQNKVYFIGIGGIGMSAIARYYLSKGYLVGGYDLTPSPLTEELAREGASIHYQDDVALIPECFRTPETLVVYTPAIPKNHSELVYFSTNGFRVLNARRYLVRLPRLSVDYVSLVHMARLQPLRCLRICSGRAISIVMLS